jgi:NADH dehydrogenase
MHRVVIVGGGFGGLYTALQLEHLWKGRRDVSVTLINRDNYFLMTPLLFEAGSGTLDFRHAVTPIRAILRSTRFMDGMVEQINVAARTLHIRPTPQDPPVELAYDQLVLAVGSTTNSGLIPGSEHAFTFKTLGDAVVMRNHVIDAFERADVEPDPQLKKTLLTFVIIGAGLVGVELLGELSTFARDLTRDYFTIDCEYVRFVLLQRGPAILTEMQPDLAEYTTEVFRERGIEVRTGAHVKELREDQVVMEDGEIISAGTIVVATGVKPSPIIEQLELPKDKRGRVIVDGAMRCAAQPEVWALGDCAAIPDPKGDTYPPLAQHALLEARQLAKNIAAVHAGKQPQPFVYTSKGTLAALGGNKGIGQLSGWKVRGLPAWFIWRTYYLLQMPGLERKFRIMLDWTVALFFRPDITKLDLSGEDQLVQRLAAVKSTAPRAE